jgi:hypothetical protein
MVSVTTSGIDNPATGGAVTSLPSPFTIPQVATLTVPEGWTVGGKTEGTYNGPQTIP